jgi:hypothetical protein
MPIIHAINNFYNSKVNTFYYFYYFFTVTQPSPPCIFYVNICGDTQQIEKKSSTIPVAEFASFVVIQEDPQVQKMLKNKSSQNQTKPILLHLSRRVDSGHIFTSSNGHRMHNFLRFDQIPK